ncbi:MAG: phosphatidate cytidylyltransferase [Prevotella sp.]|nr:phosphatidate cytidylyltransferase [Prevotella sp.]
MNNLITRTITGIVYVVVMVLGMMRPDTIILLFALITGLTMWEYTGLVNDIDGVRVNRFISTIAGVYLVAAVALWRIGMVDFRVFLPYILTIVYMFVEELYLKQKNPINDWAYTMLGQMYVALPFSLIFFLAFQIDAMNNASFEMLVPLCLFVFLWANDTGAYCTGSLLGRHKLFPRISPGKTWEGSVGGAVLVLIVAGAVGYFANKDMNNPHLLSITQWLGLGLVVVVFGTWGDLVESLFKRTLGIKDSGNILPGHGGMLDRFDSSLLAIPAAVMYLYFITLK